MPTTRSSSTGTRVGESGRLPLGPVLVACLVGLISFVRVLWFVDLPLVEQVIRIPDDAFYYLVLARNFAETGAWTFDHQSTTSGFHPLHAFFLAGASALIPGAAFGGMLWASGLAAVAALTTAAYLIARTIGERFDGFAVFASAAVLTSPLILMQTTTVMESPWVILAGALCYRSVLPSSRAPLAAVALVGAFGSFARTDFGLLPATMLVVASVLPMTKAARRRLQLRLVVLLVGASAALALFLLYVYGYSGHWLQSSARMKSLWGDTADTALQNYFLLLFVVAGARTVVVFASATGVQWIVGVAKWGRAKWSGSQQVASAVVAGGDGSTAEARSTAIFAGVSGAVAVLGYIVFFGTQNLAPQTWYSAAFVAPLAISIGIVSGACVSFAKIRRGWQRGFAGLVALAALGGFVESQYARFPHQANMLGAALWLKENPQPRSVAAFNAGLLSYFSEARVVNLDGLVNDDIFGYASRNALADYLDDREIGYLLDYPGMWEQESLQRRGGFSDGDLNRRLRLQTRIPPIAPNARWLRGHPTLMRVDPAS